MKKILIVEDEPNFARFLELELVHASNEVTVAYDGAKGLDLALVEDWDIILLDVMLPIMNGFEICREIRKTKNTPIIMLTARDNVTDRVSGLDYGADDYIPKPFAIEELFARMRALFRRLEHTEQLFSFITFKELSLDLQARTIKKADEIIELTKREFDLLAAFMQNINIVMSREILLDKVWGYDSEVETNVVDVYVRYLRRKLGDSGEGTYIQTHRGIGYVMRR